MQVSTGDSGFRSALENCVDDSQKDDTAIDSQLPGGDADYFGIQDCGGGDLSGGQQEELKNIITFDDASAINDPESEVSPSGEDRIEAEGHVTIERAAGEEIPYVLGMDEEILKGIVVPSDCARSGDFVSTDEKDGPVQFASDSRELSAVETKNDVFSPGVCNTRGVISGPNDVSTQGCMGHSILLYDETIFVFDPGG
jgi:hypothetical protein